MPIKATFTSHRVEQDGLHIFGITGAEELEVRDRKREEEIRKLAEWNALAKKGHRIDDTRNSDH